MRKATLLLLPLALVAGTALADRDVSRSISVKAPRGRIQRVVVDIPAGEIRIRNGASDELTVNGVISRDSDGATRRAESQKVVDDIGIDIVVDGDEATIRRRLGPHARGWRANNFTEVDLRIDLPEGVDVEVGTRFGEVKIDGTFGDVAAELSAGEIDFRTPRKAVGQLSASCRVGEVRADLGDHTIDREGIFPGRTYFVNADGKGHVKLHVTAGEVRVKLTQ